MDKEWQDILKRRNAETTDASGKPTAWDDAIKPEVGGQADKLKKIERILFLLVWGCIGIAALGGTFLMVSYAIGLYNCGF